MNALDMMKSHPKPSTIDAKLLAECIEACMRCQQSCIACGDACLAESMVDQLRGCIRSDLDCADACAAAVRMLSRQTESRTQLLRAQIEAMQLACRICAEDCEKHAKMHAHCRICAEACRKCEDACRRLLSSLPAQA